eukprot:540507-Hanusia_phi.AAC.5
MPGDESCNVVERFSHASSLLKAYWQNFADVFQDPEDSNRQVYLYPCGLVARLLLSVATSDGDVKVAVSMFNDTFYLQDANGKYVMWNPDNTECTTKE